MAQTLVGNLKDFNLNDILQLLSMARQTGALNITHGANKGIIYFKDGIPVHAKTAENTAEGAIYEIFGWREGQFFFIGDTTEERTIKTTMQNIVMEAARRIDEWERVRDLIPDLDVVVEFNPNPQQGSENIKLVPAEWQVLSLVNGTRTIREISKQSIFDEFETCKILYGLLSSGLLRISLKFAQPAAARVEAVEAEHEVLEVEVVEDIVAPISPVTEEKKTRRVASLKDILFTNLTKSKEKLTKKDDGEFAPQNPVGFIASFINELLKDYETPQGLYGGIKLRDTLSSMLKKIANEIPTASYVEVANNRLNARQVDQEFPPEKLATYDVYQALKKLISWIFDDAKKSLSPRSAAKRYETVLSRIFADPNTLESLGLEDVIERKQTL